MRIKLRPKRDSKGPLREILAGGVGGNASIDAQPPALCRYPASRVAQFHCHESVQGAERIGAGFRGALAIPRNASRRQSRFCCFPSPGGTRTRGSCALFLAHDLGIPGRVRGLDAVGVLSHGSCQGRVEQAPLPRSSGVRGVHRFARGKGGRRLIHQAGQLG